MTSNIKGELMDFSTPKVMGILNITPDSFFSGSRKQTEKEITERVIEITHQGADMIDIGAYSSRPSANFVDEKEEWERLRYGLKILFKEVPNALVSVDTFRSVIAQKSVEEFGVSVVNDISGGELDPLMFDTIAQINIPYILMHMQGTPQTMMQFTHYNHLIKDIILYFSKKVNILHQKGVNDIWIDPGFGFSKTTDQNYELLVNMDQFSIFDLPLLVGLSRKTMIREVIHATAPEALNGTTALNMFSLIRGADILRVHDVKEAVETVRLFTKIKQQDKC